VFAQKVAGKIVTMKCKHCSAPIRVDGTGTDAGPAAPPQPRAPSSPRLKTPAPIEDLWALSVEGKDDRELSTDELIQSIATGVVPPQAIVWRQGMPDWVAVTAIPELAEHLPEPPSLPRGGIAKPSPSTRADVPKAAEPVAATVVARPPAPPVQPPAPRPGSGAIRPREAPVPRATQEADASAPQPALERPLVVPPPPGAPTGDKLQPDVAGGVPFVIPPTLPPSAAAPWSIAAPTAQPSIGGSTETIARTAPPKPAAYEDVSDDFDELNMTAALRRRPRWPWLGAAALILGVGIWLAIPEREEPLPPAIPPPISAVATSVSRSAPVEPPTTAPAANPATSVASSTGTSTSPQTPPADLKEAFARSLAKPKAP
jgi:hypothetical protein